MKNDTNSNEMTNDTNSNEMTKYTNSNANMIKCQPSPICTNSNENNNYTNSLWGHKVCIDQMMYRSNMYISMPILGVIYT